MKKLNKKYTRIVVEEVLAQADMEGLIAMGCSRDEYSPEANIITDYIMENESTLDIDLLSYVCSVCFNKNFFPNYSQFDFIEVARCILMNLGVE